MVQQNVSFSDIGKYIVVIHKSRIGLGIIGRGFQVIKAFQPVHLHQKCEIQGPGDLIDVFGVNIQLFFQPLQYPLIHILLYLQADDLAPLALL